MIRVRYVKHAKEDYMTFSQGKRPLRVLIASRLASTTTELEKWLVNARVLAGGIHGQRLEAPFDGHVIEL